jgi:NAD(P)H-hydrate epimerase
MENAASALVLELVRKWPDSRTVAVLCGPGNNGGDGLVAARLLSARGRSIRVWTLSDPESYRGDAAENAARARSVGLTLERVEASRGAAPLSRAIAQADVVVDALFGTGLARPLSGLAARIVSAVNRSGRPVLSADVPSGLSSDTGELIGPAVRASGTVAFGAPKMCHVSFPARAHCGEIRVADIGISRAVLDRMANRIFLAEAADVRSLCPPRPLDSHKGTFGRLAVIAGSRGKAGAAVLAARGALRAGAGLVTVFCAAPLEAEIVSALPEAMTLPLPEESGAIAESAAAAALRALAGFDAAVVGPGLSTAPGTVAFLRRLLAVRLPLVCDADALNSFAGRPRVFRSRVITPHPGEAARLLACTTREIQADRIAAARRLARRSGATVVLKGAASLVATPAGEITVNPTGTPLMATAGSGDVLAGALGAGLARGLAPAQAAVAAAWLHGAAGERLAARLGDAGLLASELADAIPPARRDLLARAEPRPEAVE